ncbi:leucyl aminopeptidase [Paenarthrobacter aurescens]|uniref:Probable cytosol aminopeptidase n=1 Tax=Paenarthrobacter aurescens TaxID=43663 RepID=A0A4Y3NJP0_PAEAU|nr:leucyl aminopeptidase [Paenarthrobacter aurescens]MDO6145464.1 leucyl aminopeptidase [Paenarthrobacter aurescens]MDO6149272.1 leucyl aminopeptidase [Paenarthrobacter aurescens]MDO6160513.1 leucyl aminopeptidase [Paenarthrobacter aurescens]MDO6164372.1 leucyl aminopeptidase [Paenarthrobacter aurescens]GEB21187.1 putative cytosol aminopeptidase [Paenarthrobacter aurescens]
MNHEPYKLIPERFSAVPSLDADQAELHFVDGFDQLDSIGVVVPSEGDVPASVGLHREALESAGFDAKPGTTLQLANASGTLVVAVGGGKPGSLDADGWRKAAAALVRATQRHSRIGLELSDSSSIDAERLGQVLAEGVLLARYSYDTLKSRGKQTALSEVQFLAPGLDREAAERGVATGRVKVRAATIARDLCNAPPSHLTAAGLGEVSQELGKRFGFTVEEFNKQQLIDLRCGGLLGVNAGSAQEPRMIKLSYKPEGSPTGHLGLVGKGIMYDSGGVSLKPSDPMHLLMKMDMGGAAAVLAVFTALRDLECKSAVTGFLMCTDNMPSGSAYKLGDVLTTRSGLTIEVKNTDAEGRLVMCDAMTLAVEDQVDGIVDIATLTGAALMSLGQLTAPVFGNDQPLVDRVLESGGNADEQVWQLPLERAYRPQLDSDVADISNLGGPYAGSTTAALFLAEFVGDTPWAHIDIAGTMQSDKDDAWRSKGATGFGARLLIDLALGYSAR